MLILESVGSTRRMKKINIYKLTREIFYYHFEIFLSSFVCI